MSLFVQAAVYFYGKVTNINNTLKYKENKILKMTENVQHSQKHCVKKKSNQVKIHIIAATTSTSKLS